MVKRPSQINATVVAEALAMAEKELERPPSTEKVPVYVELNAATIKTRPELFQPRRFSEGLRDVDPRHVKNLRTRIDRKGELDPPLVVKIGKQWVCVDGHHRVAAYVRGEKPNGTIIRCEWFSGTVREAADEGLRRNEVIKLPINQADRFEEAWRRTLNGWGSKREVVQLTGTSDGIVAMMRRVVKQHGERSTPEGRQLGDKLGTDLSSYSWSRVRAEWVGLSPAEYSIEEEAAKLARILSNRLTNKLSDPEVTARALWIYDPDLCRGLVEALAERIQVETDNERMADEQAREEEHSGA